MNLSQLHTLQIDGFWEAFEDLPPLIDRAGNLQVKLGYLRDRFEASADPLL